MILLVCTFSNLAPVCQSWPPPCGIACWNRVTKRSKMVTFYKLPSFWLTSYQGRINWGNDWTSPARTLWADERLRKTERVPERAKVSRGEPERAKVSQSERAWMSISDNKRLSQLESQLEPVRKPEREQEWARVSQRELDSQSKQGHCEPLSAWERQRESQSEPKWAVESQRGPK